MKKLLSIILILTLSVSVVFAEGFPSLKMAGTARSEAMGFAYTTVVNDGSAGFWNPAGLMQIPRRDAVISVHRWIQDVRSEFAGFGWKGQKNGWGFHILYTDAGEIEQRTVPSPTPISTFSAHELIAGISYSRKILPGLDVGMTGKFLYEKIYIEEAVGWALDFGFLYSIWENGPRLGGVLQNLGKTNALRDEEIELPMTGRFGVSYVLNIINGVWTIAVDGVKEKGFPFHVHSGIEYTWKKMLSLRFGYQSGYDTRDISAGLGVYIGRYRLGYSYMPLGLGLGDSHRFSFGIGW